MGFLIELLLEVVLGPILELVFGEGLPFLFRPLGRALRSAYGGWALLGTWAICAVWFWAGWRLGMSGASGFPQFLAIASVLGSPAFALICAFTWSGRIPAPSGSIHS